MEEDKRKKRKKKKEEKAILKWFNDSSGHGPTYLQTKGRKKGGGKKAGGSARHQHQDSIPLIASKRKTYSGRKKGEEMWLPPHGLGCSFRCDDCV